MLLSIQDLCNFLGASSYVASRYKKKVLHSLGKEHTKAMLSIYDVAKYENISVTDILTLLKN